jgi:hypothetical protein
VAFPQFTVVQPASAQGQAFPVVLHALLNVGAFFGTPAYVPVATDLSGNVVWYYPQPCSFDRMGDQGTFMVILPARGSVTNPEVNAVREVDLAGNPVRETNARVLNEQLAARGGPAVTDFHHEVRRLPTGDYLPMAARDMAVTNAGQCGTTNGNPKTCDVIGDLILILNPNLQLKWFWDAFTSLTTQNLANINRRATLGETCGQTTAGCSPITAIDPSTGSLFTVANDWMHANAVQYTNDGNLIISVKNQDVVMKLNYHDGSGDGRVLWTMGNGGDFSFAPPQLSCYPWFSHQHDSEFQPDGVFTVFDNGDLRSSSCDHGNSRGQAYTVDEVHRTVTPLLNKDLGGYSFALGSAQSLDYGGAIAYSFNSGTLNGFSANGYSQTIEVDSSGTIQFILQTPTLTYRTFRLRDLYSPPER